MSIDVNHFQEKRKSFSRGGSSSKGGGALNGKNSSDAIIRASEPNSQEVKSAVRAAFEKALAEKSKSKIKGSSVGRAEIQEQVTRKYRETVSDILNAGSRVNGSVLMGYTPSLYQKLGMPSLPFVIGGGHIYTTAKTEAEAKAENRYRKNEHYHGLGESVVKDLYEFVQEPVAIIAAKDVNKNATPLRSTHSVVEIIDVGTRKSLLMPILITAESSLGEEKYDVNLLSSVYEKNVSELMREAIAQYNTGEHSIYYIKKEADSLISQGVQFPQGLSADTASDGIVCRFPEKVNMKIAEATQSQQFKRWFGDWQNDPSKASKVVNEDGTPKVVYHGTDAENIHVFQNESGAYWFSESEDYAEAMAEERGKKQKQIPKWVADRSKPD